MAPRNLQGYVKNGKRQKKNGKEGNEAPSLIPLELQQLLLNIFKDSFAGRLDSDIQPLLQEVKGHLFNRDFQTAFGRDDYLEAYSARWSPSRALGYLQVLAQTKEVSDALARSDEQNQKVVCLGGGAGAEIAAFGGFLKYVSRADSGDEKPTQLEVVSIDMADWSSVITNIHQRTITAPVISKYASAALKAANVPLVDPASFKVTAHQHNVLETEYSVLDPLIQGATLVTLMFTLNELYTASLVLTQKFLLSLTTGLPKGALLLVVDSPGSYSSVTLNGTEKRYPMQWLLDHTLLQQGPRGEDPPWEKLIDEESRWFRMDTRLNYPIDLENMRYQMHLYRRLV